MKNIYKVLLLESILIRKKILWRKNFVLIKFLLNGLLFEKSWNECKINNFSVRLCVLSRTMVQWKCGVAFLHSWLHTLGGFLLVHESELSPSTHSHQGELNAHTWDWHSYSLHYFCIDEPSWGDSSCLGLAHTSAGRSRIFWKTISRFIFFSNRFEKNCY